MMANTKVDAPYRGLLPFHERDAPFFFGRETETRLIIANLFSSPLTLLYAASGVGKTSVLHAGVLHQLRQRDDLAVVIWDRWQGDALDGLNERLREIDGSLPESATLVDAATRLWSRGIRLMVIFDQFEEYFVYHPNETAFDDQFSAAVRHGLPMSFVISMREDQLFTLDRYEGSIPRLFDNYLRLNHLDRIQARDAIEGPVVEYNRQSGESFSIEPQLVADVLDQLQSGTVGIVERGRGVIRDTEDQLGGIETPFLQLVMQRLWRAEREANSPQLRAETLRTLGGAERISRTHLDDRMTKFLGPDRDRVADLFHFLVTPSGTKIAHSATDLAAYTGQPGGQVEKFLQKLSEPSMRILRSVPPALNQPVETRYEIFHDVLGNAILDWRSRHEQTQSLAEEKRVSEVQQQVAAAGLVQQQFSSIAPPNLPGYEIATRIQQRVEVGGDFLTCLRADQHSADLAIGDVIGHGVPAALRATAQIAYLRAVAESNPYLEPGGVLSQVNSLMMQDEEPGTSFTTMALLRLSSEPRQVSVSTAGFIVLLCRSDGNVETIGTANMPLGIMEGRFDSLGGIPLAADDLVVAATDGVEETRNPTGELFGRERVLETIRTSRGLKPFDIVDAILAAVKKFSDGEEQSDDIAILVIKATQDF